MVPTGKINPTPIKGRKVKPSARDQLLDPGGHHQFLSLLWFHLIVLALASFALYANSLGGGFVWDDRALILQNPIVQNPSRVLEAFQGRLFLFTREFDYFRPLAILTFGLDQLLWLGRPFGFHLTNVLLNSACVLAFYFLASGLWGRWFAFLSALLFSFFACHTENVSFIAGRMDVLCTLFLLLGLLVYFRRAPREPGLMRSALCSLSLLCAQLSKELGAVFPILFVLLVVFQESRDRWQRHFRRGALITAAAFLIYAVLRIKATGLLVSRVGEIYPFWNRMLLIPGLVLSYLQLLVFPYNLNARHITPPPVGLLSPSFVIPLFSCGILLVALFLLARHSNPIAFGALWFLAALLPVLNLLPLEGTTMADRFLYLPSAGFAMVLAGLLEAVKRWKSPLKDWVYRVTGVILIVIGVNNAAFTVLRNPVWHDEIRFFSLLVRQVPDSCIAHHNLGYAYYREGNLGIAESEFRKAVSLNPNYAESHASLGDVLTKTGRYREAITEYETYLKLYPEAPNRSKAGERIQWLKSMVPTEQGR